MDLEKKPVVSDVGAWAMNVVSSVGIIMANKQLMSPNGYAFGFGTLLPRSYSCLSSSRWELKLRARLPLLDTHSILDVPNTDFSFTLVDLFLQFFILLSCSLAVFCNMSQYLCIGRFSATSFQVLGHMKTVCVLILGWILFDSALTLKNILGMLLAVLGMVVYSWAVEHEKQAKLATHIIADSQSEGEDAKLLKKKVNGLVESDLELGQTKS
ncbi:hypothetical protein B296_00054165 [Ensete ventricosum]|uniref:EamA domain-containing protein n=1 Tax=Ensete ventricosum TaxID=4639 RepID=A0A426Y567_ENSVE|nr:hypothetical protein B296_00054165 [Ensete ventricosum]